MDKANKRNIYNILKDYIRDDIIRELSSCKSEVSPLEGEQLVVNALNSRKEHFSWQVKHESNSSKHTFPDLIVQLEDIRVGIEVKTSKSSKNKTLLGNSIFESTRSDKVDVIYLVGLFEFGQGCEVKIEEYGKCITNIVVTHSPRYELQFDPEKSIFSAAENANNSEEISYADFARMEKKDKVLQVRNILRRKYGNQVDNEANIQWFLSEENSVEMSFKQWNTLDSKEQKSIFALGYILFPEVIVGKYNTFACFLNKRQIIHPNVRDSFTSNSTGISEEYTLKYGKLLRYDKNSELSLTNLRRLCLNIETILDQLNFIISKESDINLKVFDVNSKVEKLKNDSDRMLFVVFHDLLNYLEKDKNVFFSHVIHSLQKLSKTSSKHQKIYLKTLVVLLQEQDKPFPIGA